MYVSRMLHYLWDKKSTYKDSKTGVDESILVSFENDFTYINSRPIKSELYHLFKEKELLKKDQDPNIYKDFLYYRKHPKITVIIIEKLYETDQSENINEKLREIIEKYQNTTFYDDQIVKNLLNEINHSKSFICCSNEVVRTSSFASELILDFYKGVWKQIWKKNFNMGNKFDSINFNMQSKLIEKYISTVRETIKTVNEFGQVIFDFMENEKNQEISKLLDNSISKIYEWKNIMKQSYNLKNNNIEFEVLMKRMHEKLVSIYSFVNKPKLMRMHIDDNEDANYPIETADKIFISLYAYEVVEIFRSLLDIKHIDLTNDFFFFNASSKMLSKTFIENGDNEDISKIIKRADVIISQSYRNELIQPENEMLKYCPHILISLEFESRSRKEDLEDLEDQKLRRTKNVLNLYEICEQIKIDNVFMDALKQHSKSEYIEEVMKFKDDMAKKAFIFLEFIKERSTCQEMVNILIECGQTEAAKLLYKHNTSPPFIEYTTQINLEVTQAAVMRSGGSKLFNMDKKPRGMCIIINNVEHELRKESLRFRDIFEQLFFMVKVYYNMTANQMKDELERLSQDKELSSANALIVMIISHGHDEKIIGFDEKDLRISEIVDIFSEIKCPAMKRKPKLFFFNCCRSKEPKVPVMTRALPDLNKIVMETVVQNWINKNKYTSICFTCAEGYKSWFTPNEYTFFGQVFSHCIAQYACDKSFQSILNLTCERMSNTDSPEIRLCNMTRDLYFNPGLPKQ